ncbi:MAG: ThuA domain-containing protein [Bacteroidota bacterium]
MKSLITGILSIFLATIGFAQQNDTMEGLILTGKHHPGHNWEETTPVIKSALEKGHIDMDVSTDIEDLARLDLAQYDFLVLNYNNWDDPEGLSEASKNAFTGYLKDGGGLLIIHFANGAWHYSLPEAGESDWPEFRQICRRVWDHDGSSAHDDYGKFTVKVTDVEHKITEGISDFQTTDELYYNQVGDAPVGEPLLVAKSEDTGKKEPQAWTYRYGTGKIFQSLLGHDAKSLSVPEVQQILRNAAKWAGE